MELDADLVLGNDMPLERARARQSRPDVLLELGMALVAYPQNSVVVEVGQLRPLSVSWLHGRLLRGRLANPDRFVGIAAYRRG